MTTPRPIYAQLRPAGMKLPAITAPYGTSEPLLIRDTKSQTLDSLIVMPAEQKPKTIKHALPPGRSFFDFPTEIRLIIYKFCLTDNMNGETDPKSNHAIVRVASNTTHIAASPCSCSRRCAIIIPNVDPIHLPHMVLESSRHGPWKPAGLMVALLRLNKQIHDEAARVLYGSNTFEFQIGVHRHNWHIPNYNNLCRREYFDFDDNFLDLPPHYLRMVRKCSLRIRLLASPYLVARDTYLKALERVTLLTEIWSKGHSLLKLSASLVYPQSCINQTCIHHGHTFPQYQNVLEPLGALYGIRDVRIDNVEPVFQWKLTMALKGNEVACTLAEEVYVKKMVKVNGRKRPRTCRVKKYHESRYTWKPTFPVVQGTGMHVNTWQGNQLSERQDAS